LPFNKNRKSIDPDGQHKNKACVVSLSQKVFHFIEP